MLTMALVAQDSKLQGLESKKVTALELRHCWDWLVVVCLACSFDPDLHCAQSISQYRQHNNNQSAEVQCEISLRFFSAQLLSKTKMGHPQNCVFDLRAFELGRSGSSGMDPFCIPTDVKCAPAFPCRAVCRNDAMCFLSCPNARPPLSPMKRRSSFFAP